MTEYLGLYSIYAAVAGAERIKHGYNNTFFLLLRNEIG